MKFDVKDGQGIIPEGTTEIPESAFDSREDLVWIELPESVTKIGDYAFQCCKNLTEVFTGESLKEIGDSAFEGCRKMSGFYFPNSMTKIGEYAFASTGISELEIPSSIEKIGDYAFSDCKHLSEVWMENKDLYAYLESHDKLEILGEFVFDMTPYNGDIDEDEEDED